MLNILQLNVRSLPANKEIINEYIIVNRIDITIINETWLKKDVKNTLTIK